MTEKKSGSMGVLLGISCGALGILGPASYAQSTATVTAMSGARQTFKGLGTSMGNWGGNYQQIPSAQRSQLAQKLWQDTHFKVMRIWFNMDDYNPSPGVFNLQPMRTQYIDSGMVADALSNGVTTLVIGPDHYPPYMVAAGGGQWKGPIQDAQVENFAAIMAQGIRQFVDASGFNIEATGIMNEPTLTPAQAARLVKALRTELNSRGLTSMKIIAPESSSVDQTFYDNITALKNDSVAWNAMSGIASHSYNMASTDTAASFIAGSDGLNTKEYWMTEASENGAEDFGMTGIPAQRATSLATRFLSDMNHRVTHWVHFLGIEEQGDGSDDATRIFPFKNSGGFTYETLKKYYTYQQLGNAFDSGAVFRDTQSSLEGDMTWTYGKKPKITAATARNPDGSWSVGITNFTANSFSGLQGWSDESWNSTQNGYTPAENFNVTIKIDELANSGNIVFNIKKTDGTLLNGSSGTVTMVNGLMTVPVNSLDLVTLRSGAGIPLAPPSVPQAPNTDKIRFWPRQYYPERMIFGRFEGTNGNPVTGPYDLLATVSSLPTQNAWNELPSNKPLNYRYLRYVSPDGGYGNVAEIEFYQGATKLTGTVYGSGTSVAAFDNNTSTFPDEGTAGFYTGIALYPADYPSVALTAPVEGDTAATGSTVNLAATASDSNGTVSKVEFYQGTTKLGEDLTSPYTYAWTSVPAGAYSLTAKATDNQGNVVPSGAVNIRVSASPVKPTVSLTAPTNGTVANPGSTVNLAATAADSDGSIAKVEFFQGLTKLGEDLTSPYTYAWTSVPAGDYVVYAKATDNGGNVVTSNTAGLSVSVGALPEVYLTAPRSGRNFATGTTAALTANATDADGTITQVQFYAGATLLNTDTTAPYAYNWATTAAGSYAITAKATDNRGNVTTSAVINVTVKDGGGGGPTGTVNREIWTGIPGGQVSDIPVGTTPNSTGILTSLESPSNIGDNFGQRIRGYIYPPTSGLYTFWIADDQAAEFWLSTDNTPVNKVKVCYDYEYAGVREWNKHGVQKSAQIELVAGQPYYFEIMHKEGGGDDNVAVGWAKPGEATTVPSEVIGSAYIAPFTATSGNIPPAVSLTSPSNGASFTPGSTINLAATATDSDGTVAKVEFFQGSTKLGEDLTSPYTYAWTSVAAGSYALTARATDNTGDVTNSSTVNITVAAPANNPPTVSLTAPTNGSTFNTASTISLAATAADSDGTVSKVEFFQGTTKLGEDLTSPYTYDWTGAAAGTYSLTAKATDNSGNVTTSSAVSITVNAVLGTGTGLKGDYFSTIGLTPLVSTRTDATINFDWGTGSPVASVGPDQFSIRWTGQVQAIETGTYTFSTYSDDGVRLWVNNVQLVNDWNSHPPTTNTGTIALTAGQKYDIKLEYFEDTSGANVQLGWIRPGQSTTVIVPQTQLYPAATNAAPTVSITAPTAGTTYTAGATINIAATAADSDGTVSKVEFFQGTTKLGEDLTSPYTYAWTGAAAGTYSLTAKATDNGGAITTSSAVSITVNPAANVAPTVSITSPANGATATVGGVVNINATAADSDGTITKVEFYQGTTLLGQSTTSPYTYAWTPGATGTYSLTAKATDNSGAVTTSSAVSVTVSSQPTGSGTISREVWTGVGGSALSDIPLTTTPNITDTLTSLEGPTDWADSYGTRLRGYITAPLTGSYTFWIAGDDNVALYLSTNNLPANKVNIASHSDYTGSREWNKFASQKSGAITLTAGQQYYVEVLQKEGGGGDNLAVGWLKPGQTGTVPSEVVPGSALSPFSAPSNVAPTVSITAPTAGATFTAGATINITANAADSDGTVSKVEFFQGATKLGEDLTSPYTYTWTGATAGSYSLTAKATDNSGAVTTSSAVSITVNAAANVAPTVSITAPTAGTTYTVGATINIAANAADSDGTVSKVEFFQGSTKLGEDLTSPYTYAWTGAAAGTYSLTAKATDNSGAVTTSSAVSITVNAAANVAPTVSITAPTNGASVAAGTTINIAANAADSDGTVSKVEFFQGATKLGEDLTSPYTYAWTGATAGSYSLTAKATDNSGAVTTSSAVSITVTSGSGTAGTVKRELWTGVSGNTTADIPTGTTPTSISTLTTLEGPSDIGDNYGQRISGYITAPTTGSYTFWIAGDDAGDFYLSTNNSPANKTKLCFFYQWVGSRVWNNYTEQKSAPVTLTAGQSYYFEILHKEGAGGDSIAVGWLKPGQTGTVPSEVVPSSVLTPAP